MDLISLAYAKKLANLAEGPQGPQGEPGSGAVGTVAEAYSTTKTYAVGDYVIHDEEFYRCTTAITTAEAFNSAHWTKLVLTDEVSALKSDLIDFTGYIDLGLLAGYTFSKSWNDPEITLTNTGAGVLLSKSEAVNATCRFRPTGLTLAGLYDFFGKFNENITFVFIYENDSLIETLTPTNREFSYQYNWDGIKVIEVGFMFPYNINSIEFILNIYDAESLLEKINALGNLPPYIIGSTNTFFGDKTGENTSETQVTDPDDGKFNAAFGTEAMKSNTSGDHCSAFGYKALHKQTTGDSNTAFGEDALYENLTGSYNTAVGGHALQNSMAAGNTAVGSNAARYVTSGAGNTVVGSQAGHSVQTGSRNIIVGTYSESNGSDLSDTIVIGNSLNPTSNGEILIGGQNCTSFVVRLGNSQKLISFNNDGTVTWSEI